MSASENRLRIARIADYIRKQRDFDIIPFRPTLDRRPVQTTIKVLTGSADSPSDV